MLRLNRDTLRELQVKQIYLNISGNLRCFFQVNLPEHYIVCKFQSSGKKNSSAKNKSLTNEDVIFLKNSNKQHLEKNCKIRGMYGTLTTIFLQIELIFQPFSNYKFGCSKVHIQQSRNPKIIKLDLNKVIMYNLRMIKSVFVHLFK